MADDETGMPPGRRHGETVGVGETGTPPAAPGRRRRQRVTSAEQARRQPQDAGMGAQGIHAEQVRPRPRRRLKPRLGASADAAKPACAGSPNPGTRGGCPGCQRWPTRGVGSPRRRTWWPQAPRRGFNRLRPGVGGVPVRHGITMPHACVLGLAACLFGVDSPCPAPAGVLVLPASSVPPRLRGCGRPGAPGGYERVSCGSGECAAAGWWMSPWVKSSCCSRGACCSVRSRARRSASESTCCSGSITALSRRQ